MALVNGSDYDHIDLHSVAGGDVTRHMLKDAQARQDVSDLKSALTAQEAVETKWEQGTINTNTGADLAGTTRIRTTGYIDKSGRSVTIDVPSGMKASIRYYSEKNANSFVKTGVDHLPSVWETGEVVLGADQPDFARIVIGYAEDANIDAEAGDSVDIISNGIINGQEMQDSMKEALQSIGRLDKVAGSIFGALSAENAVDVDWESGTLSTDKGMPTSSTTRIRTLTYIKKTYEPVSIAVPSGMKVSVRYYNQPLFAGYDSAGDWETGNVVLDASKPAYARIVAAYTDDSTISADAGSAITITKTAYIDGNVKDREKAADANATQMRFEGTFMDVLSMLDNEQVAPNWQLGSIHVISGATCASANRVRTAAYLLVKQGIKVTLPAGFMANVFFYTEQAEANYVGALYNNMQLGPILVPPYTGYVRIIVAKTDNGAITVQEASAVNIQRFILQQSLTVAGKAADAKAVGDRIAEVEAATAENINGLLNVKPEAYLHWERGSLNTITGGNSNDTSTTRIRSDYMQYIKPCVITIGDDIKYSWRSYGRNGAYIGTSEWIESGGELILGDNVDSVRFVCAHKTDSTDIAPDDDFTFEVRFPQKREGYSITKNESATGNVSIRAAKTILCNDGTPPIIDWYLVQTVNNQFYRSKDLKSKEYLFTFTPPSGIVSNWSAGITATNDIIFVADAAGLSDAAGRLNDANRINPVCFLASENYSTMHVIDFGSALKPCGWLENVGYCVLPNGDAVFCEYTRGIVHTANAWLISGDVFDPENWTVTWSHDVIDTTDVVTSGIKHCHEMQYDFYTGILYLGTGDSPTGSHNYYSTDNGKTWNDLLMNDKDRCRRLTFVFTADKVYWASDSFEAAYHHFFIANRDSSTGVVDVENAQSIALTSNNSQACYGCVYLQSINTIVMMDRVDGSGGTHLDWYCYDIDSASVKKIGSFNAVTGNMGMFPGFRCKFVDWYPVDNAIHVGFNPESASVMADTNQNALCGNIIGRTGNGTGRINNLVMYVYKNGGEYSYRASTVIV